MENVRKMEPKKTATNGEIEKDARIKKEYLKLKRIFRDLDKNMLSTVDELMKRAAFMAVTLHDVEQIINDSGYTESYQNGEKQKGVKESAAVRIHLSMTKNYSAVVKQLTDLVPPERKKKSALAMLRDE